MKLSSLIILTSLNIIFGACQEEIIPEEMNSNKTACSTFILGDKDGFGVGLKLNQQFDVPAGVALPIDNRSLGEASFTDIYPADMGNSSFPSREVFFEYIFDKPTQIIQHAKLNLLTLGIQDGDNQVSGSDTDITLFLDNVELPEAFDEIDQFDCINGKWSDFVSMVQIEIPNEMIYLLYDGTVQVRMEILQRNQTCESFDAFAIDYCELEVCSSSVSF
jgi:hypothetical protein